MCLTKPGLDHRTCWLIRVGQSKCLACMLSNQEAVHMTQWGTGVSHTHHTQQTTMSSPFVSYSMVLLTLF